MAGGRVFHYNRPECTAPNITIMRLLQAWPLSICPVLSMTKYQTTQEGCYVPEPVGTVQARQPKSTCPPMPQRTVLIPGKPQSRLPQLPHSSLPLVWDQSWSSLWGSFMVNCLLGRVKNKPASGWQLSPDLLAFLQFRFSSNFRTLPSTEYPTAAHLQ